MRGLCCPGESLRRAADEVPQCGRWNANSISPRRDHQFLQWSQVSGPPPVVGQGVDRAWHLLLPLLRTHGSESSPVQERSEEHTSELQSRLHLVCRLLLEKKTRWLTLLRHAYTSIGTSSIYINLSPPNI